MQTDHSNALRGLSIATIVVAGLCLLACVIGFIALGVGGAALSSVTPDMLGYYDHGHGYDYGYGYGYDYGYDYDDYEDFALLMGLVFGLGGVAIFFELAVSAVALIAGIFGLRYYDKREKMNMLFGWSLAGAIVSLLGGNIVSMVLLIIMCVFSYKDKQLSTGQPVVAAPNAVVSTVPAASATPAAAAPASAAPAAPATQPVVTTPAAPGPVAATTQPAAAEPAATTTESAAARPATSVEPAATAASEEPKAE